MKRFFLFLSLLCISLLPVFSWDWGLNLSNESTASDFDRITASQTDRATLWASFPLRENLSLYVSGLYEFSGDFSSSSSSVYPWRFDLGRTELSGRIFPDASSQIFWSVGRIPLNDYSGRLVAGLNDGLCLSLVSGKLSFFAAAADRGYLFKEDAKSFLEDADYDIYDDDSEVFAPNRVLGALGVRAREILPFHDCGLELWGQYDMDGQGTVVNTQYIEPFIEGRAFPALRYRLWQVTEMGEDDGDLFWSLGGGGHVRWTEAGSRRMRITGSVLWAMGTADGFRSFTPIQQDTLTDSSLFSFSDVFSATVDANITPVDSLSAGLSVSGIFRMSDNAPAIGELRDNDSGRFMGVEAGASASLKPFSDLSLTAQGGLFVPNTGTMYVADQGLLWTATVQANLAL